MTANIHHDAVPPPSFPRVIVAGVDGSPASTAAALWAGRAATRRGATLNLVHAFSIPVAGVAGPMMMPPDIGDVVIGFARTVLEHARNLVAEASPELVITTTLEDADPVDLLRRAAQGADLVVLGAHGAHHVSESLIGTVPSRIAGHVRAPVVVVRLAPTATAAGPGAASGTAAAVAAAVDRTGPVIVGVDGSPGSEDALAFAFEEASERGTTLIAVRAWDDAALDGFLGVYPLAVNHDRIDLEEQRLLGEQLAGWTEKYPDVPVREVVLRGRAAATLLAYCSNRSPAEAPALLVVGSRGRGEITARVLGSTGHALVAHAGWPVAVVRRAP